DHARGTQSTSAAARLDRLPVTRSHWFATIATGVGAFFDLFDIFLAGVLGVVLTQEFHLSRLGLPAVIGSGFLCMFFGSAGLGTVADCLGRRRLLLLNLAVFSVFPLLGAFSVNAAMVIATRFMAGIGLGAEPPLVDTYLSELLPARERGRFTVYAYTIGF